MSDKSSTFAPDFGSERNDILPRETEGATLGSVSGGIARQKTHRGRTSSGTWVTLPKSCDSRSIYYLTYGANILTTLANGI